MPIKDKSLYPPNWKDIRKRILEREGHCCKTCGVENYSIGYRDYKGEWNEIEKSDYGDAIAQMAEQTGYKVIKIVLTIAHLDHDPTNNNESNLAALCQLHHLRHDAQQHKANAAETRNRKKGLQKLF
jgi:hypothetical protein